MRSRDPARDLVEALGQAFSARAVHDEMSALVGAFVERFGPALPKEQPRPRRERRRGRKSRLSRADVEAIRASPLTGGQLARKYKLCRAYVNQIKSGERMGQ